MHNNMEHPSTYYFSYGVALLAVIAVTFVMAKVRVRMRQLDHRKVRREEGGCEV